MRYLEWRDPFWMENFRFPLTTFKGVKRAWIISWVSSKSALIGNQPFKRPDHHETYLTPYHTDIMAKVRKRILCKRRRKIVNLSERPDAGKYHGWYRYGSRFKSYGFRWYYLSLQADLPLDPLSSYHRIYSENLWISI